MLERKRERGSVGEEVLKEEVLERNHGRGSVGKRKCWRGSGG